MIRLLCKLDFTHVESSDPADGILLVYNSRSFTLCLGKNYVHKVLKKEWKKKTSYNRNMEWMVIVDGNIMNERSSADSLSDKGVYQ